jgi:hypothetical protein
LNARQNEPLSELNVFSSYHSLDGKRNRTVASSRWHRPRRRNNGLRRQTVCSHLPGPVESGAVERKIVRLASIEKLIVIESFPQLLAPPVDDADGRLAVRRLPCMRGSGKIPAIEILWHRYKYHRPNMCEINLQLSGVSTENCISRNNIHRPLSAARKHSLRSGRGRPGRSASMSPPLAVVRTYNWHRLQARGMFSLTQCRAAAVAVASRKNHRGRTECILS